jgi:peroxiredoxin
MFSPPASPAPELLAELVEKLDLNAHREPIFLTFFRVDCPWCAVELPRMAVAFNRHLDLKVHVIGVAVGDADDAKARAFADEKGWTFPVVADQDGTIKKAFSISRVPSVVLVDGGRYIQRLYQGVTEQLVGILEQTILAAAHAAEPPDYNMVGNGCAP